MLLVSYLTRADDEEIYRWNEGGGLGRYAGLCEWLEANVLNSSLALSKDVSPCCSTSNALILERDMKVTSAIEESSMGIIADTTNKETGMQLRFEEDAERALVVTLVRASGSVVSVILFQEGLAEGGSEAKRMLESV